ncbi:AGAP004754-PA [Anopheles gambiae str. PEST]|uniref:AGAP004754-PA n=3 Tax=gambiae species complex TaxID=44542 RepID=Q7Q2Q0_ANOGA|nr:caspase Dronc [Anopheles coluzzii]XP_318061.4 caspase Dronc [Anopheles gambiae]EAA13168.4 AGAP004754-PA [Anopheles gambiae str. PEST]
MNNKDRFLITHNVEKLVNYTNYKQLSFECIQQKMLSPTMVSRIEGIAQDEVTRHKKLFEKITKRGPKAFDTLLAICQQAFPTAYLILKPNSNDNQMHSTHNPQRVRSVSCNVAPKVYSLRSPGDVDDGKNNNFASNALVEESKCILQVYPDILPTTFSVKLSTRPAETHPKVPAYPMKGRNRGVAFIVNVITFLKKVHPTRNGADIDGRNLISVFQQLGFVVFYYEDITMGDLKELLAQLKESEHLSCDCFAFYILSHGDHRKGSDYIFLHDNSLLRVEDLLTEFNSVNCKRLVHKPKLFFISICRGVQSDLGAYRLSTNTERDGMIDPGKPLPSNIATYCDMLVCYATVPGFAAHRDTNTGSWFVESMCKIWSEHAHDTDVEILMKLVGEYASSYRTEHSALQTICTEQRGFFKQLFLNPGYYENPVEL